MRIKLFVLAYALFGAYLTTSSFIIHKSDLNFENPALIFIVSFLIFFMLSFLLQFFFTYLDKNKIPDKSLKITSILMTILVIGLLINLLFLTYKYYSSENVFELSNKLNKLTKLNQLLAYVSLGLIFFVYSLSNYTIMSKNIIIERPIIFILFLLILISLIPLSILLDILIRIAGFAIGLAGGL